MKKFGIRLPVLCALILLASVTALATVVSDINGLTLTDAGAQNNVTITKPTDPNVPAVFTVKQTNAVEGKQYLVVVRKGEADDPTADVASLFYMGMEKAENGQVSFSAYPKEMGNGSYCVYMSTYGPDKLQKVATFDVEGSTYIGNQTNSPSGDFDGSGGEPDIGDVVSMIDLIVNERQPTAEQLQAADFDDDDDITIGDVTVVINLIVG